MTHTTQSPMFSGRFSSGSDTIINIENLTGSNFDDTLVGDSAVNILNGGIGSDNLSGGTGSDSFFFNTALNATTNNDTITDFNVVDDTINLENAIFTSLITLGSLSSANFISGAGAVSLDSNDFLIYDTTDGSLYYDADGNGAGARIEFVSLTGIPVLTSADFVVV